MNLLKTLNATSPIAFTDVMFHRSHRRELFLKQDLPTRLDLIRKVTNNVRSDIVNHIPDSDLVELLEQMPPDEATDVLQLLGKHKREHVLTQLSGEMKSLLSSLLEFDPNTAAGLMKLDYILVELEDVIADVAAKFKRHERRTGRPPVILVTNKEGKLTGYLPGHAFGLSDPKDKVSAYVDHITTISYAAKRKEVMQLFNSHPHSKVVVLNDSDNVLGIIYSDDVLKLLHDDQGASLYDFAGISQEESVTDSARSKVKNRYRWLIINLGTAFLAAYTVGQFEDVLSQFVLLAVYMPIVAGMGGNAATQTLAVLVRGISLRQIELKNAWRVMREELGAGLINGLINGIIVAVIVSVFSQDYRIALILGLAMIINLVVASIFGTLVPLIMSKLGKDPAASATIFITTATDVLGFLAFLGLATLILL